LYAKSEKTQNRRAAMGRFRRAQKWTEQLRELCKILHDNKRLTEDAFVQVSVYALLLNGRIMRLRDEFDHALASLSVGRTLLDQLSGSASTSHDQAVATVFIDEISPEIRHCAHSLGFERAYEIDRIVKKEAPRHAEKLLPGYSKLVADLQEEAKRGRGSVGKATLGGLVWEGQPIPVRNPELVGALLKVELSSQKLWSGQALKSGTPQKAGKSRSRIVSFDGVLQALNDAEEVARKLSEAQKITGGANTAATGTRDIHFVHSYITYQLLSRRTERDSLLIDALIHGQEQTTKAAAPVSAPDPRIFPAVVKILDTVLQSLTQMRGLTIVDESLDITSATEARIAFIRSQR
jgi:signal recognition particle subunit SRP68